MKTKIHNDVIQREKDNWSKNMALNLKEEECYDIKFISSFNEFTLADIYKLILFNFPYFSFYNVLEFL